MDSRGFFTCAEHVPLPPSADGTYTYETKASAEVRRQPYEGSYVYVEYRTDCEGDCRPPSAPPAPPPSAPPPPLAPAPPGGYSPPPPLVPPSPSTPPSEPPSPSPPHAPMSLPPPSGADDEDGSVSLGFEVDATPETFDADAFTASLADELGVDAATLSTAAGTMCRLPCLLEPPNLPLWAM